MTGGDLGYGPQGDRAEFSVRIYYPWHPLRGQDLRVEDACRYRPESTYSADSPKDHWGLSGMDDESHPRVFFEVDKLIRSIYTLRYLRDPQLRRNVHRSQNRIEPYHQLRSAVAQIGGKEELSGRTDIEIEISNQCARLAAARAEAVGPRCGRLREFDAQLRQGARRSVSLRGRPLTRILFME